MTKCHVGSDCQLPAGGWRPGAPPSKEAASPRHPLRCTRSQGGRLVCPRESHVPQLTSRGPSTPGAPRQPGPQAGRAAWEPRQAPACSTTNHFTDGGTEAQRA